MRQGHATVTAAAEQPARVGPAPPRSPFESLILGAVAEAPLMRPCRVTPRVSVALSVRQPSAFDLYAPE
jgi:hypothetical protein